MTKVNIQIDKYQALCLREYRCLVHPIPSDDNVPVGHPVTVTDPTGASTETIIVAVQQYDLRRGLDLYVLAHADDISHRD
jgi:transcription elongation GreA/GreB family factor